MKEYLVIDEMGEHGEWGASSPDLPGCVAVGETQAEVEQLTPARGRDYRPRWAGFPPAAVRA
jgi:hypothetical protein